MGKGIVRQWVNVLMVIATIAVNGLANALPFNGQTTGAISDRFKVLFVPAGYVFAIWGVIYLGLVAFAIYQVLPSQRDNPRLRRIGLLFPLSCLANMVWIFLWHYGFLALTVVVMLTLLLLLIGIYLFLGIGRGKVSAGERWLVHLPFSIYLGWITVATVANVTDLLYSLNWNGFGLSPEIWAVVMLIAATAIAVLMSLTRGDWAYLLVIIWAFIGIAIKQAATPLVATTAWAMTVLVALVLPVGIFLHRRR
jgi:hypothetical protein